MRAISANSLRLTRGDGRRRADRILKTGGLVVVLAIGFVWALPIAGCGQEAQKSQAQKLQNAGVLSNTAPLDQRLITQSEIASAPDTNGARTLLQLWSLLQYQAWDRAAQMFQPGLQKAIGTSLLLQALEQGVLVWQATKPRIVSTTPAHGASWIAFLTRDEHDSVVPASISLQGGPGKWQVSYFSLLNGALARSVQLQVQAALDPLATKPNPEAVRQAIHAGTLQDAYLAKQESERNKGAAKP
jgi:hypothetical protein